MRIDISCKAVRLSIVIPAYNEAPKIRKDLRSIREFLENRPYESEVIIVDDGSSDNTPKFVREFIEGCTEHRVQFRLVGYHGNRGKGYAVRYGISQAQGEWIAFMDVGLCVPLFFLERGIERIEQGYDFAIASRRLPQATIRRAQPLHRRVGSKAFWFFVRGVMGVRVTDTQCGFKIYSKRAGKEIFAKVATDGFMFDIEALLVADKLGLRGAEFPVEWSNDTDSRYHPLWGTLRNFRELMKIRFRTLMGESLAR